MVRYLLDTNTASYAIKGNVTRVREQSAQSTPMAEVGISVITEAELRFGVGPTAVGDSFERSWSRSFFCGLRCCPGIQLPPIDYAEIRATLERSGKPMGNMDMLIAAHALAQSEVVLVTHDRVFRRVKGLKARGLEQAVAQTPHPVIIGTTVTALD